MAYKKIEQNFSFADIAIQNHSDKNRTYVFLKQMLSPSKMVPNQF
ncbi:hypothetical protein [Desulfocicer niacini]